MKLKFIIAVLIIFISFFSCKDKNNKPARNWEHVDNQLIKINKYLVREDIERIESYIERNNWNMEQTKTGLWYEIINGGQGVKAADNDIVSINYTVKLLDGTICYSSDSSGTKTLKIGKSNVENGLFQGLKMMNKGCKARFIIPPHLGWGLLGDDNKIPSRAILVYNLELLTIN